MGADIDKQVAKVISELEKLAKMSPGGGLYIEDIDCAGGIYSLNGIVVDESGHIKLVASMWNPNELARKTGLFRY